MKRFSAVLVVVAVTTLVPSGAARSLGADPVRRIRAGLTQNWAGYVAHGGPFTSVSTTWVEPSISCAASERSAFASFAGLDGSGSSTVEQIGTLDGCRHGRVTHQAFYEMFPRSASAVSRPVRAGDSLTASVVRSGATFTLSLVNHTAGWSFSIAQHSSAASGASAEAIVEAPTLRGKGIQLLSNFSTVNYNGTTANGQPIANFGPEAVTMVSRAGVVKATPSGLSGGSFSVTWHHA